MISRRAAYAIAASFVCTLLTGGAYAQEVVSPAACQRYRAELASLPRGGGQAQQYAAAAQRQRAELDRTRGYYQQLGCDRGGGLFGGQRPADCGSLQTRISQMQANYDLLRSRASGGDAQTEARRRELSAAAAQACAPRTAAAPRQRGFFEMLFGGGQAEPEGAPQADLDGQAPPSPGEGGGEKRLGGSRAVCVRLADGYFFPLGGPASGRSGAQELCQAQCPASPTELFFMAQGGNVAQAISATGRPYSDLPSALQYERTFNPAISCRQFGESWAQALQPAEFLLERRKSDIIVTAEKAEELSRPKTTATSQRTSERQAAAAKAAAAAKVEDDEDAADNAAANDPSVVPTASAASSGIGPQSIEEVTTVDQGDGALREEVGPDGQRRKVRIVAPYLVASPQNSVLINPH